MDVHPAYDFTLASLAVAEAPTPSSSGYQTYLIRLTPARVQPNWPRTASWLEFPVEAVILMKTRLTNMVSRFLNEDHELQITLRVKDLAQILRVIITAIQQARPESMKHAQPIWSWKYQLGTDGTWTSLEERLEASVELSALQVKILALPVAIFRKLQLHGLELDRVMCTKLYLCDGVLLQYGAGPNRLRLHAHNTYLGHVIISLELRSVHTHHSFLVLDDEIFELDWVDGAEQRSPVRLETLIRFVMAVLSESPHPLEKEASGVLKVTTAQDLVTAYISKTRRANP